MNLSDMSDFYLHPNFGSSFCFYLSLIPYNPLLQAKEVESDPLLSVENGNGMLGDGGPKAPVWTSNKDLHA